ncbi:MAG: tyrosine-type recombinase/integrase [Crinalium sp.]
MLSSHDIRGEKTADNLQNTIQRSLKANPPPDTIQFDIGRFGLDQNPAAVYLARLSPKSRRSQLQALNVMAGILTSNRQDAINLPWWQLRYQHTAALRNILADQYAPATVNRMLAALRGALKECLRLGLMNADDHARAVDLQNVKSDSLPSGRALKPSEIAALMKICLDDNSAAGYRDAALIAIARCGLRRGEIVKLTVADFDSESGGLKVRRGKGRKDRIVYLPSNGIKAVADWVNLRNQSGCKSDGALLVSIDRFDRLGYVHMADQSVLTILKRRAKEAGIDRFSPHDFRRTFISDLLEAGADIVVVQKLAGHSDPGTTARYDRRGEDVKREAMQLLDLPYQR